MRVTRSKARLVETESLTDAVAAPSIKTSKQQRTPLGDITEDLQNGLLDLLDDAVTSKPNTILKPGLAIKESRSARRRDKENIPEVLEDDFESDASSAVDDACEELMRPAKGT